MSYDSSRIELYTVLSMALDQELVGLRFDTIKEADPITSGDKPWVRCYIDPFDTFQASMGTSAPLDKTLGHLMIEVYDKEDNGFAEIYRIADQVKKLYLGKSFGDILVNRVLIMKRELYHGWNSRVVQVGYTESEKRV